MRMKVAGVFVLFCLISVSFGQTGSDGGWTRFTSQAGKFSVLLPAQPHEDSATEKGVLLHTFTVLDRPRMFMMLYSDYPAVQPESA